LYSLVGPDESGVPFFADKAMSRFLHHNGSLWCFSNSIASAECSWQAYGPSLWPTKVTSSWVPVLLNASSTPPHASSSGSGLLECEALLPLRALYASAGGATSWRSRGGWMAGSDSCSWYGVSCNGAGDVGAFVGLKANMLVGTLPSQLGLITSLSTLQLGTNRLSGRIPSQLGILSSILSNFDLSSNLLTSTIPSELGQLTAMVSGFTLNSNSLQGSVPSQLGRFSALVSTLKLGQNKMSGVFKIKKKKR
jgi:hypothetical protein